MSNKNIKQHSPRFMSSLAFAFLFLIMSIVYLLKFHARVVSNQSETVVFTFLFVTGVFILCGTLLINYYINNKQSNGRIQLVGKTIFWMGIIALSGALALVGLNSEFKYSVAALAGASTLFIILGNQVGVQKSSGGIYKKLGYGKVFVLTAWMALYGVGLALVLDLNPAWIILLLIAFVISLVASVALDWEKVSPIVLAKSRIYTYSFGIGLSVVMLIILLLIANRYGNEPAYFGDSIYSLSDQTKTILRRLSNKDKARKILIVFGDTPELKNLISKKKSADPSFRVNKSRLIISKWAYRFSQAYSQTSENVDSGWIDVLSDPQLALYFGFVASNNLGNLRIFSFPPDEFQDFVSLKRNLLQGGESFYDLEAKIKSGVVDISEITYDMLKDSISTELNNQDHQTAQVIGIEELITGVITSTVQREKEYQICMLAGAGAMEYESPIPAYEYRTYGMTPPPDTRPIKRFEDFLKRSSFRLKDIRLTTTYDVESDFPGIPSEMQAKYNELRADPNENIPAECDVVMLSGPRESYSKSDMLAIFRYIDKGGDLIYLIRPRWETTYISDQKGDAPIGMSITHSAPTEWNKLLKPFGLSTRHLRVGQTVNSISQKQISDMNLNVAAITGITESLYSRLKRIPYRFIMNHPLSALNPLQPLPEGVQLYSLLETDEYAFEKSNDDSGLVGYEPSQDGFRQKLSIGYIATRLIDEAGPIDVNKIPVTENPSQDNSNSGGNSSLESRLLVIGDLNFLAGQTNSCQEMYQIVLNSLFYLVESERVDEGIPARIQNRREFDPGDPNGWTLPLFRDFFMVGIPLILASIGLIAVYFRRRYGNIN